VVGESVMALSVAPAVRTVTAVYSNGQILNRGTTRFNAVQQQKTHLEGFRYLALGMQRDRCIATVTGYDRRGDEVFTADTEACVD
jgi:hypothetical protein